EGEITKAIADLIEVTKLNPKFTGAYVNRAATYIRQHEFDKAISDYNTAIEIDPKFAQAYTGRAHAHAGKREYAEAISDMQTTLRLNPKHLEQAFNSLAWLLATCREKLCEMGKKQWKKQVKPVSYCIGKKRVITILLPQRKPKQVHLKRP